jgi:hypothetical protein
LKGRGLALALLLLAGRAGAQPNIWDAARDPKLVRDEQTLVAVERVLSRDDAPVFDPTTPRELMRAALTAAELAGRPTVSDPRLLFFVGELLSDPLVGRDDEAREVLDRALAADPSSPLAGRGWFNVAIASARLADPKREHDAYTHALELTWERGFRANIFTNRAESAMVLGHLDRAVADYEKAIELADRPDLQALAYYGLGIARERSGDLPASLDAMRVARNIRLPGIGSALDLPSVFFVPDYDVHYYKALSAMSAARDAKKPQLEAHYLALAASQWQEYLAGAVPDQHRWVPNARRHEKVVLARLKKIAPPLKQPAAGRAR